MDGKINQANENRKRRMMHHPGTHHTPKYHPNPSLGFSPRNNRPPMNRPTYTNRGKARAGGNHNNPGNSSNFNRAPPKFNNNNAAANTNTAPRTGSNVVPVAAKDKSQVTCYDCGNKGHYSNECPNKKNAAAPNANAPAQQQRRVQPRRRFAPGNSLNRNGHLFLMHAEEAQEAPDVMLGMFSVNSVLARVLFGSGASHSFVTEEFSCTSKIQPTKLKHVMIVQLLGSTTKARQIFKAVPIRIHGIDFYANLIVLETKGLEVVQGMDWMSKHKGLIDCAKKSITMTSTAGIPVEHISETLPRQFKCNKSIAQPTIDQVRIVCEYPDVFPDVLPGMPPDRDIEFIIELIPGT